MTYIMQMNFHGVLFPHVFQQLHNDQKKTLRSVQVENSDGNRGKVSLPQSYGEPICILSIMSFVFRFQILLSLLDPYQSCLHAQETNVQHIKGK
jgi:hypothetical protein